MSMLQRHALKHGKTVTPELAKAKYFTVTVTSSVLGPSMSELCTSFMKDRSFRVEFDAASPLVLKAREHLDELLFDLFEIYVFF